jgi:hypothetical protein
LGVVLIKTNFAFDESKIRNVHDIEAVAQG